MKESKISEYNFSLKKEEIKKIFNTPNYQKYKQKSKKIQKRKENIYKFISLGLSTNIIRNLIIINVFIFAISFFLIPTMFSIFSIYPIDQNFAIWQPLTSLFLHGGFFHLLFNMIVLWSFGNPIEKTIGTNKFLQLYFISGLISSIFWVFLGTGPAVGASGAISGLMSAFIFISPESKVLLFFVIPMKIKNAIYGFAIFSLVFGVLSLINPVLGFGIGHFAHLGGLVGGYLLTYYWKNKNLIPTF